MIAVHLVDGGLDSWNFIHVYYWTEILQLLAALPVLWWLYRLDGRALKAGPLLLTVLPASRNAKVIGLRIARDSL